MLQMPACVVLDLFGNSNRTNQLAGRDVDPVLWVGVASCAGALAPVAPVPTLIVAVFTAGLLFCLGVQRHRGGGASPSSASSVVATLVVAVMLAPAVLAFVLGAHRGRNAIARHEEARATILNASRWPSRCVVTGTIARSPTLVGGGLRVEVDASDIRCRDGPLFDGLTRRRTTLHVPRDVLFAFGDPTTQHSSVRSSGSSILLGRGDVVSATASLAPPYRFWNDGTGDPRPASARRGVLLSGGAEDVAVLTTGSGVRWTIDRARERVRERIIATFPPDTAAMARALVLGEDDVAGEDQRAFRKSGLAHLLAVSGMHLVLVVMGLVAAMRAVLLRVLPVLSARHDVMRVASLIGLPIAWAYADLAGGSGSAVRAAWMCSVVLLARAIGRRSEPWRALGLSLVAMSALDPLVVFDLSFVLSALATIGILALARPIEELFTHAIAPWLLWTRRIPAFVIKPFATTVAATIACAPVLTMMAPELALGGLIANVIAVPLGEAAALPLCLVHALLFAWPAAESGCAIAASGALTLVRLVARAFAWGVVPVPSPTGGQLAVMASMAIGVALGKSLSSHLRALTLVLGAIALAVLEIAARVHGAPHATLRVTFIDVGQGDATLIDFPDGSAMLVDGGGLVGSPLDVGERAIAPVLAARRRSAIDVLVLSHPHPDHYLGLSSGLARAPAKSFWDTGQGEAEGTSGVYAELLASVRARNVIVRRPTELCGSRMIGGAVVDVLAPCPAVNVDHGANDNSFVLRIRFGERAILLVGDAEREEESELLARLNNNNNNNNDKGTQSVLRADVLKVGHHGSRTSSTPAFLDAVSPRVAVISCGVRNRFGHPHPQTMQALKQSGARVLRTDRDGSVIITTDGHSLDVRTMAPNAPNAGG